MHGLRHARRRLAPGAALGVLVLLATTACATQPVSQASAGGRIAVVAGENFWGNVLQQIGGSHVSVTSIITDPNTDPHEYASSAADAGAVAGARLVVENGIGYDDFLGKLIAASPSANRTVLSVQQALHVTGSDPNPHIWYDTARMPAVASAFADALGRIDPADAAVFTANAAKFDASLHPIETVIAEIRAKHDGASIAYTERVPGYLVQAAGLRLGVPVAFTQAVEDGTDPAPADTAAFDAAITSRSVEVLLYNAQVTDAQTTRIKQLATASGVPIVGVTETLPAQYRTYQSWQLAQAKQLLAALGG